MAELRKAEKIAAAKKKLKQFQQKNRDSQSESGRSTPSKRKTEEEEDSFGKLFNSENGGSTNSLCMSENLSSNNISGTGSPLSGFVNGNPQSDTLNISTVFKNLPQVSENLFSQPPSPLSVFSETPPMAISHSASDFFDNLPPAKETAGEGPQTSHSPAPIISNSLMNVSAFHPPNVNASTPDGPLFQDTPTYSFDSSVSPIREVKNIPREISETELKLNSAISRNSDLEQEISEQKNQIIKLQSHLEELKKNADEGASTLKHHLQAIEILVSEKSELQNMLDKNQDEINIKTGELEELQGRLRASRHRVSELERELNVVRSHAQALETTITQLTNRQTLLVDKSDSLGKRVGDLEVEVSDLQNKLESRDKALIALQAELDQKTSQLSLSEVRIQQLSGGLGTDQGFEEDLRRKNEDLTSSIQSLEIQLQATRATHEEAVKDYQRYVNKMQTELQELKTVNETSNEQCQQLRIREQQLVQQVSELERQLNRAPQPVEDVAVQVLREQLLQSEQTTQNLQSQLSEKANEVEALREGLQERALRIQELEITIDRLEAERPDTANLQAAIESDKVAASRAVTQNNNLKRQLEELQEALVKLSNNKLELTQRLQYEQHLNQDLMQKLEKIQESKATEVERAQQTESPVFQESEAQTTNSHSNVSPEAMIKLEEKFRKTMSELADLSDEKQRLEHIVLQLQSETETIGEYITLYQIQRGMLRQRAQEKDEQVAKLGQDKEALRNKLAQLNCLVQRLVGNSPQLEVNGFEEIPAEMKETTVPTMLPPTANIETAQQIQSLLTEIGSNNLVTSTPDMNINFHPCPWCSGRLITV